MQAILMPCLCWIPCTNWEACISESKVPVSAAGVAPVQYRNFQFSSSEDILYLRSDLVFSSELGSNALAIDTTSLS